MCPESLGRLKAQHFRAGDVEQWGYEPSGHFRIGVVESRCLHVSIAAEQLRLPTAGARLGKVRPAC